MEYGSQIGIDGVNTLFHQQFLHSSVLWCHENQNKKINGKNDKFLPILVQKKPVFVIF